MERLFAFGKLFAFYGACLTKRQREIAARYADEDWSLCELAEEYGISRQAVRDSIVRSEREMLTLEEKLRLIRRTEQSLALTAEMRSRTADADMAVLLDRLDGIWEDEDGV